MKASYGEERRQRREQRLKARHKPKCDLWIEVLLGENGESLTSGLKAQKGFFTSRLLKWLVKTKSSRSKYVRMSAGQLSKKEGWFYRPKAKA